MPQGRHTLYTSALGLVLGGAAPAAADAVLDGTTGTTGTFSGDFEIPAAVGRRAGGNLFHSFERFSVLRGESATFTGPTGIDNVISRVTGGDVSTIDGELASTIPGADFFFLNPAGVVFGPEASLDVDGSFHVSTADELRFDDGSIFSARDPSASSFTVAAPEAFGFLGADAGAITVDRGRLEVGTGATLALVGGDITVSGGNAGEASGGDSGRLRAEAGQVIFSAVAGPGAVALADGETTATQLSDIHLTDEAFVDTSGGGGGTVQIRGGRLMVENQSFIFADNIGTSHSIGGVFVKSGSVLLDGGSLITADALASGDAGHVSIAANELELRAGGVISSSTFAPGDAGGVVVEAEQILIDGVGSGLFTGITSQAGSGSSGAAATVLVSADHVRLSEGGMINTSTFAEGSAGAVIVDAGRLLIDGAGSELFTGISSQAIEGTGAGGDVIISAGELELVGGLISSDTFAVGDAGRVEVRGGRLEMRNGGVISSGTFGEGNAGQVVVAAERLAIFRDGSEFVTGITSNAEGNSGGDAGRVEVRAGTIEVRDGGEISSGTFAQGDGGAVTVAADRLVISGDGSEFVTGIIGNADRGSSGAAGAVRVHAGELEVRAGGQISSATFAEGDAGTVAVEADRLVVSADGSDFFTGITSNANEGAGDAGQVQVRAGVLEVRAGGEISSNTFAEGNAGAMTVEADRLTIDGAGLTFTGISTQADVGSTGAAGAVQVDAGELEVRAGGQISSSTFGPGEGGEIRLRTTNAVIDGGAVATASFGQGEDAGTAGGIMLEATDTLQMSNGAVVSAQTERADAGDIEIRASRLVYLEDSAITTSVAAGTGGGGNIRIDPGFFILNDSAVVAQAREGAGGNIEIEAGHLFRTPPSIISASSDLGIDGQVMVDAPDTDVTSGLVTLPTAFVDASSLLRESCAARQAESASSFVRTGQGGLAAGPDALLPGSYAGLVRSAAVPAGAPGNLVILSSGGCEG